MAAPEVGVVTAWASTGDVCSPCDDYEFDTALLEDSILIASQVLFELTGRRWAGERTETVRPMARFGAGSWQFGWSGWWDGPGYVGPAGQVGRRRTFGPVTAGWCGCSSRSSCGCNAVSEVRLPGYPVTGIDEVRIDGQVVNPARYRVDDYRWLVYIPESDSAERQGWPCCQDIDADSMTDEDTWEVTYSWGTPPPEAGVRMAGVLGCQIALSCQPETVGQCRLPKRITNINRQGVQMAVLDPLTVFADGMTGLPEVDLWVQAVRWGDRNRRATVAVPGWQRGHRRADT